MLPSRFYEDMLDEVDFSKGMKCDIYEKDGNYHIEMDVPGFDKSEIKIEAKNNYLTITAEKNNEVNEDDEKKNYIHRERYYGKYQRSFYLEDLDQEKVSAEFKNGILKIKVPKKEENEDKKYIEIK